MMGFLRFFIIVFLLAAAYAGGHYFGKRSAKALPADTIRVTDTCYLQSPTIVKEIPVPVPMDVDTAAILASHYTKRIYTEDVISTPSVKITVVDTIFNNELVGRTAYSDIKFPSRTLSRALSMGLTIAPQNLFLTVGYRFNRWNIGGGWDFDNNAVVITAKYDLFQW